MESITLINITRKCILKETYSARVNRNAVRCKDGNDCFKTDSHRFSLIVEKFNTDVL